MDDECLVIGLKKKVFNKQLNVPYNLTLKRYFPSPMVFFFYLIYFLLKDNCFTELSSCVFVALCRLSLTAASGGYSLVAVCRLLVEVASLVVEHGL